MIIRRETPDDYAEIHELIKASFAAAEHSDGDEQNLAKRLRTGGSYLPELALVAEEDGRIAGHLMITAVTIREDLNNGSKDTPAVTVAPLSVLPQMQGKGIGGALLREGHRIARQMGYGFCVLLGHAGYYPRFGYRPASSLGIRTHLEVPDENYMAIDLQGTNARLEGEVHYPPVWGLD